MKRAAGLLLHRVGPAGVEVLLVHPSGNYNRGKPWSIPKGEPEPEEDLEATARRETREETGIDFHGPVVSLGDIRYLKSGKVVHAWAAPAPDPCQARCASWEVDAAEFVPLQEARQRLHPDQRPFLDRLVESFGT